MEKDPSALERFQREARAASALNHPNICTIYEIGQADGRYFIAMELLEGKTLKQRIGKQAMEMDVLLELAIQIADALEAAHSKGIIHRDIKPANIFVTSRNQAKVLDFGLAKQTSRRKPCWAEPPRAPTSPSTSTAHQPWIHGGNRGLHVSRTGARQGTRYAHRPVFLRRGAVRDGDRRAPFRGDTSPVIFEAILNRAPVLPVRLNPDVPLQLEEIIIKLLEKDRDLRYQSAAEVRADLKRLKRDTDSGLISAASSSATLRVLRDAQAGPDLGTWCVMALVVLAVLGLAMTVFLRRTRAVMTDKDAILVTDFVNTTADPVFDGTLKKALAVDLEQSPYLNVFPEQKVRQTLQFMGRTPDERITGDVGREICQRVGIKAMLNGSIANLGSQYVITLDAVNAGSGESLAREEVQAGKQGIGAEFAAPGRAPVCERNWGSRWPRCRSTTSRSRKPPLLRWKRSRRSAWATASTRFR